MEYNNYTNPENPERKEPRECNMTLKDGFILLGSCAAIGALALIYMTIATPKGTIKIQPVQSELEETISNTSPFK